MAPASGPLSLPLEKVYYSNESDLAQELQIPLLERSLYYDRGVGFFTSGWLKAVARGIARFASNGGTARIITSPKLQQSDWETILGASESRRQQVLAQKIAETVDELERACEFETLSVLGWMIHDGILEFRLAVPAAHLKGGDFHTKVAFFRDDYGGVGVHGSMNDSEHAFRNAESVSVFTSSGTGSDYYAHHLARFEQLWSGQVDSIMVFRPSDEALKPFLSVISRTGRPYQVKNEKTNDLTELRPYQRDAISAWEQNGRRGILEMATGTGKTFTAIAALQQCKQQIGRLGVFVLVPYIHLIPQWSRQLSKAGFEPVECHGSVQSWHRTAKDQKIGFELGLKKTACWLATHATASRPQFLQLLNQVTGPKVLVADEAHGLGASHQARALCEEIPWRLGLSATPRRWYDESGTRKLMDYFDRVVYEFGIRRAIDEGFLTRYQYHPCTVELEDDELSEVTELGAKLAIAVENKDDQKAKKLALRRARILNGCENILPVFLDQLDRHRDLLRSNGEELHHTLVYCSPGRHKEALRALADRGIRVHEFVAETAPDVRQRVLERFETGDLQALVAIKCLDEGVDVPSTRTAYILASSTNPREFVQRRGRILRRAPGKHLATVHDFLVGCWEPVSNNYVETARSLLRRCLPRFAEFAGDAENQFEARSQIFEAVARLNMISHLDKRPWEAYAEACHEEPLLFTDEETA